MVAAAATPAAGDAAATIDAHAPSACICDATRVAARACFTLTVIIARRCINIATRKLKSAWLLARIQKDRRHR
eukprot:1160996-Pelagomonas_calceolata.AAC.3